MPDNASILDVYPTILDMLGVEAPATGERRGISLLPQLAGAPAPARARAEQMVA